MAQGQADRQTHSLCRCGDSYPRDFPQEKWEGEKMAGVGKRVVAHPPAPSPTPHPPLIAHTLHC